MRFRLLVQEGILGLKLLPTLLGNLAAAICLPGFLQGSGAGLTRSRKGCLGVRVGTLMLEAPRC